jgi:16S rRNA (adenine1518-N6/adenine1519-N6)-dimethyltransferase
VASGDEERRFRSFVQEAFGMRRKQMRRVLRSVAALSVDDADSVLAAAGVDPEARPETLTPETFARVARAVRARQTTTGGEPQPHGADSPSA